MGAWRYGPTAGNKTEAMRARASRSARSAKPLRHRRSAVPRLQARSKISNLIGAPRAMLQLPKRGRNVGLSLNSNRRFRPLRPNA
jgi:hypothetical protein